MPRGRPRKEIDVALAEELLRGGLRLREVAARVRCSPATLKRRLEFCRILEHPPEWAAAEALNKLGPEGVDRVMGAWLARRHRKRPRLAHARPVSPARAPHYLSFIRGLSCTLCGHPGPNEAAHHGRRGVGQKTDDYRTVPLCQQCHRQYHDGRLSWQQRLDLERAITSTLVQYLRIVEQT